GRDAALSAGLAARAAHGSAARARRHAGAPLRGRPPGAPRQPGRGRQPRRSGTVLRRDASDRGRKPSGGRGARCAGARNGGPGELVEGGTPVTTPPPVRTARRRIPTGRRLLVIATAILIVAFVGTAALL